MARPKFIPTKEDRKIAKKFKALRISQRKENGKTFTYRDLAIALTGEVNYSTRIFDIEATSAQPSLRDLKLYRSYFNTSYEYLLGETEVMRPEDVDISKKLGLSGDAIRGIKRIKETLKIERKNEKELLPIDALNLILGFKELSLVLFFLKIANYFNLAQEIFLEQDALVDEMLEDAKKQNIALKKDELLMLLKNYNYHDIKDDKKRNAVMRFVSIVMDKRAVRTIGSNDKDLNYLLYRIQQDAIDLIKGIQEHHSNMRVI
ncbi:hypothetical protein tpqmel_0321 [Candidatus Gastranaerophilus sp. (ex Termes propinquus)]|nr:hypothetical protein tpqmel_0321 [Candidatus Gastranaerophilus sp. (ex Termes propinquus)]